MVCPLLRGSSPTSWSRQNSIGGLGRAFSPAFRAGSLYPLGRVGAEEFGAAKDGFSRRDAARPARAAWAVLLAARWRGRRRRRRRFRFIDFQAPALTLFITHTRARALMARLWSARCYGVARQRAGRAKTASGARACFLSGISGWFSLSLGPRGCRRIWRGENGFSRRDAARPARAAWAVLLAARWRGRRRRRRRFRFIDFQAPALTLFITHTRARALMARLWSARCYGVARQRAGRAKTASGGSGVLSLRHFGLVLFIPWAAWVPKNLARRKMVSAGAMLLLRLRGRRRRRRRFRFIDFGPALTFFITHTRARALMARLWSARCYGVARQRAGRAKTASGGSGVLSLRHFGLVLSIPWAAWVPKNLARRKMVSAGAMLLDRLGRAVADLDLLISKPPR